MLESVKEKLARTLLGAMRDVARIDALLDRSPDANPSSALAQTLEGSCSSPVRVAVTSATSSSSDEDEHETLEENDGDEGNAQVTLVATIEEAEAENETAQIQSTLDAAALAPTLFARCVREGRMPREAVVRRRQFEMAAAVWNDLRALNHGR